MLAERLEFDSRASTTKTLVREYWGHDESDWLVSRVRTETTTSRPGHCSISPPPEWLRPQACDPEANTRHRKFTYTPDGRLKTFTVEPDQPELTLAATHFYDIYGNTERLETKGLADADGNHQTRAVEIGYEPAEAIFPARIINALQHEQELVFDRSFGLRVYARAPNDVVTWTPIDGLGRLAAAGKSGGTIAFLERINAIVTDEEGPSIIWHVNDSRGGDTRIEYDRSGRATRTVTKGFDGQSIHRDIRYDPLGRVEFVSFPYNPADIPAGGTFEHGTTYEFDMLDRPKTIARPDGASTFSYKGLVTEIRSPRGSQTLYLANGLGQTGAVQDAAGGMTQYFYGAFSAPIRLVDDAGNETSFRSDQRGRRVRLGDPDLGTRLYRYNAFGELIQELTHRGAQHVRFDYDLLGRPTTRTDADGTTRWTWDTAPGSGIGVLASSVSSDGQTEAHSYDQFGRLTSRTLGRKTSAGESWTLKLGMDYDNTGRLQRLIYPTTTGENFLVQYEYGQTGYLNRVRDVTSPEESSVLWRAKRYDPLGRIIEQDFGAIENGQQRLTTINRYHPESAQLSKIVTTRLTQGGTSESIQALIHWFDPSGNLVRREDVLRQGDREAYEEFEYDALDRLSAVFATDDEWNRVEQTFSASYDNIGNKDVGRYQYGGSQPHAVTEAGDASYRYDNRGNMKVRDKREITYTPFDLPRQVVGSAGYTYDARQARAVRETSTGETVLYADGLYERHADARGKVTELFYVPANRHLGVVVRRPDGEKKLFFLHRDHLGSPTVITRAEDGQVVETRKYGPFGRLQSRRTEDKDTDAIHLGFTGHEDEAAAELVNMGGRVYDARLGRFLTPDPFVQAPFFSQSLNRYSYVLNNPLSMTDPTGFGSEPIVICHPSCEPPIPEREPTEERPPWPAEPAEATQLMWEGLLSQKGQPMTVPGGDWKLTGRVSGTGPSVTIPMRGGTGRMEVRVGQHYSADVVSLGARYYREVQTGVYDTTLTDNLTEQLGSLRRQQRALEGTFSWDVHENWNLGLVAVYASNRYQWLGRNANLVASYLYTRNMPPHGPILFDFSYAVIGLGAAIGSPFGVQAAAFTSLVIGISFEFASDVWGVGEPVPIPEIFW